jgi:hypothetical protein
MKKGVTFITSTDNPSKYFFETNFVKFLMNLFDTFAAHCISIKLKAIVFSFQNKIVYFCQSHCLLQSLTKIKFILSKI